MGIRVAVPHIQGQGENITMMWIPKRMDFYWSEAPKTGMGHHSNGTKCPLTGGRRLTSHGREVNSDDPIVLAFLTLGKNISQKYTSILDISQYSVSPCPYIHTHAHTHTTHAPLGTFAVTFSYLVICLQALGSWPGCAMVFSVTKTLSHLPSRPRCGDQPP